jgi:hypothetical protein
VNANLTPDFPTAATLLEQLYAAATGQRIDGVIVADPFALAALLELRGPVDVPGVGQVDAHNTVEVVANRAYDLFDSEDERKTVLGSIAIAGIDNLLSGGVDAATGMRTLGAAVADGHLLFHAADPQVQEAFQVAGMAGALAHPGGDFLAVIGNNGAQNKADYYTGRSIHYRVDLHPDGLVAAGLGVRLNNNTPEEGLGGHVIGPNLDLLEAGDNVTHLGVYCAGCVLHRYDGPTPHLLQITEERGYERFAVPIHLASDQMRDMTWSWSAEDAWEVDSAGGTYRLTLHNQPTIRPTQVLVEVAPPEGMEIVRTSPDITVEADGTAVLDAETRGPVSIEVTVESPLSRRVWDFLRQPVFRREGGSGE